MANQGGIRAGRAFVELFADDSRLVRGLNAASAKLKAWGQSVTAMGQKFLAAGAAAGGAFFAAAKIFSDAGDRLQKMSQRTGLSVEALSELAFAADMSGTSLETIEAAVRRMQKNLVGGSAATRETLSQLGLSLESLRGLNPEQQFKALADAIAAVQDPTQKAALAMQLFEDSGTQLLPLFAEGAAGIEALQKQARDLGLTMTTEDANTAAALNDALGALMTSIKRAVTLIGAAVAPAFQSMAEWITAVVTPIVAFIDANRELVALALKIAAAVAAAGAAFMVLGVALSAIGSAFSLIATLVSGIGALLGAMVSAATALLNPLGLVVVLALALGTYALYVSGAWEPVLKWLGDTFLWLGDIATQAWQGITDAIAAGDLELAAQIAMAGLKIVWYEALAWLKQKWIDFKKSILDIWYDAVFGLARLFLEAVTGIQLIWTSLQSTFRKLWVRTISFLGDAWDGLYYWLAKAFTNLTHLFSSASEAAAARQALDEEQAARARERQRKLRESLERIDRDAADKQENLGKGLNDSLRALDEDRKRATEGLYKDEEENVKRLKEKAEEARRKFNELTGEAKEAREAAAATKAAPPPGVPKAPGLPPDLDTNFEGPRRSISVVGTFNALAAARLGGSNPMERTARATEETAKNTRKLTQIVRPAAFT